MPINISIVTDTERINRLATKLNRYGEFAMKAGLKAANEYLNRDDFIQRIYPPSQAGSPFLWSTDKQRKKFFATDGFGAGIPTQRTFGLVANGAFKVNEGYLTVEFDFPAPYKYVIHPQYQIRGHRARGWKTVPDFIRVKAQDIRRVFENATRKAWQEMDKFITGGAPGL